MRRTDDTARDEDAPVDIGYGDVDGAAANDIDDDWHEDPDAPVGVDATLDAMGKDLRDLSASTAIAVVGLAAAIAVVEFVAGSSFDVCKGFVVGGVLATVNLWVIAGGYFAVVDQRATNARVLLATLGSLGLLLGVALWIVLARPTWTVGFGLGLAVPAAGGLVYAARRPR